MCNESGYCKVCLKPMPLNATKCTECRSYQDIRRHIFSWTSILTAIIAVVPIFSIAWSLTEIAGQPEADVSITDIRCSTESITMFAVNSGGKVAAVYDPEVHVLRQGKSTRLSTQFLLPDNKSKVEPGNFQRIRLTLGSGQQFPQKIGSEQCQLNIKIKTLDAGRNQFDTLEEKCACAN